MIRVNGLDLAVKHPHELAEAVSLAISPQGALSIWAEDMSTQPFMVSAVTVSDADMHDVGSGYPPLGACNLSSSGYAPRASLSDLNRTAAVTTMPNLLHISPAARNANEQVKNERRQLVAIKFKATALLDTRESDRVKGVPVPGIVFAIGARVCLLPVFVEADVEYCVCAEVYSTAIGQAILELPSVAEGPVEGRLQVIIGLVERVYHAIHQPPPTADAIAEGLIDMTGLAYGTSSPGLYPSPGGCDEVVRMLLYRVSVKPGTVGKGAQKPLGNARVERLSEMWSKTPHAGVLSALALMYNLKVRDKILSRV